MADRMEVFRTWKLEGSAVARQRFGDAIVTDILTKGVFASDPRRQGLYQSAKEAPATPTGDCACGGHTAPRPTYDHAGLRGIADGLQAAAQQLAGLNAQHAALQRNRAASREAARRAELQRGINVPGGRFFDHAAAARGRAASNTAHAKQVGGAIPRMNASAAEFWAKQAPGAGR